MDQTSFVEMILIPAFVSLTACDHERLQAATPYMVNGEPHTIIKDYFVQEDTNRAFRHWQMSAHVCGTFATALLNGCIGEQ